MEQGSWLWPLDSCGEYEFAIVACAHDLGDLPYLDVHSRKKSVEKEAVDTVLAYGC